MKYPVFLSAIALSLLSFNTVAKCKSVMGGCTKESAVNVAPHMRTSANTNTTKASVKAKTNQEQKIATIKVANKNAKKL